MIIGLFKLSVIKECIFLCEIQNLKVFLLQASCLYYSDAFMSLCVVYAYILDMFSFENIVIKPSLTVLNSL